MAKQTINVGQAANDGTGDPLRNAFIKANENFTEVYGNGFVIESRIANNAVTIDKLSSDVIIIESEGIGTNDNDTTLPTSAAVKDYVDTEISNLVAGAPETLDTLDEIAAAINDNADFYNAVVLKSGTSSQFLKGDGSLDSNSYLTTESDTLDSVTDRGNTTTNAITVGEATITGDLIVDTNTLYVDSANNRVGIGQDNPSSLLEIASTNPAVTDVLSAPTRLRLTDKDTTQILNQVTGTIEWYTNDATDSGVQSYISTISNNAGAGTMVFGTGAPSGLTERMRITSGGDISFRDTSSNEAFYWDASASSLGIGTTSPRGALDIDGARGAYFTTFGSGSYQLIGGNTGSATAAFRIDAVSAGSGASLQFATDGTERMSIDSSGILTVGAETASNRTSHKIQLSDTSEDVLSIQNATNTVGNKVSLGLYLRNSNNAAREYSKIEGEITANGAGSESGNLLFYTIGSGTLSEKMRITSGGNVGIGTSSPDTLLNIEGSSPILTIEDSRTVIGTGTIMGRIDFKQNDDSGSGTGVSGSIYSISESSTGQGSGLAFNTGVPNSPTEKMRITSGGQIQVGVAGLSSGQPTNKGKIRMAKASEFGSNIEFVSTDFGSGFGWSIGSHDQNGGVIDLNFYSRVNNVGWGKKFLIEADGDVKSATGSYGTISSDERLKENILDASPKLQDILSLNVKNYNYIGEENKQIGFIAQEFKQVFPSLVTERDTRKYDEDGNLISGFEDTKGLKVGMEFAILVKAIQEQQEIINDLKARIETLENQ